ncbi:hypothetical protein P154DRAFT_625648 [Amniculicola lignicola CBS 123094]|uniref:ATPase AAA-type core domain-containing protein n=1 Tax=Amniculicola lignicola CBS 123094 TaxID=1392246 RepID=A0A6A5VWA3_9PLEO|nr:hypothetical protein P154DRAFT_625648 [Amniculicola lignicola CBS 123094]
MGKTCLAEAIATHTERTLHTVWGKTLDFPISEAFNVAKEDSVLLLDDIDTALFIQLPPIPGKMDIPPPMQSRHVSSLRHDLENLPDGAIVIMTGNTAEAFGRDIRRRANQSFNFELADSQMIRDTYLRVLGSVDEKAAELFANCVPAGRHTIAGLQSFLQRYDDDPNGVTEALSEWLNEENEKRLIESPRHAL